MQINYNLIGERIAFYRKKADITQAQLSEKIGLTSKYISKLETGNSIPSVETLMELCLALDVKPNDLLFGVDNDKENSDHLILVSKLKLCNTRQLRIISKLIDAILSENDDKGLNR